MRKNEIQAVNLEEPMKRSGENYGLKETKRNPSRKVRGADEEKREELRLERDKKKYKP